MSAGDSFFVDTNVLLYRFGAFHAEKRRSADAWFDLLWSTDRGRISWQVIFEFYSNVVKKTGTAPAAARAAVEKLILWNPEVPTHATVLRAWHWCDSAQLNFWDGLILGAAEQAGCRWLLTEDFQTGRRYGTVTVVNPFEHGPAEFGLS
jgi:predicted nucleic acid-binding protein